MAQPSQPPSAGPSRRAGPMVGVVAIVAAAVLAIVAWLAWINREFTLAIDKEGRFNISVASGANLRDVLLEALDRDKASVEEVLTARGYHHFADPGLAAALARLDPAAPEHAAAVASIRQLLREQRGPFTMPDALKVLDARLVDALASLETSLEASRQTSELLVELWRQSLDFQGIFRHRMFRATVQRYPASPGGTRGLVLVMGCPGSDFLGKEVSLRALDGNGQVSGIVLSSATHHCDGADQKLADLFADQPARLGLDAETYQRLFSAADPTGALPDEMPVRFQFLPQGTGQLLQLVSGDVL